MSEQSTEQIRILNESVEALRIQVDRFAQEVEEMKRKSLNGRVNSAVKATLSGLDSGATVLQDGFTKAESVIMGKLDSAGHGIKSAVDKLDLAIIHAFEKGDEFARKVEDTLVRKGLATMDSIDAGVKYFKSLANHTIENVENFSETTIKRVGSFFGRLKSKAMALISSATDHVAGAANQVAGAAKQFTLETKGIAQKVATDMANEVGSGIRSAKQHIGDAGLAAKHHVDHAGLATASVFKLLEKLKDTTSESRIDLIASKISAMCSENGGKDSAKRVASFIRSSEFCTKHVKEILDKVDGMDAGASTYIESKLGVNLGKEKSKLDNLGDIPLPNRAAQQEHRIEPTM